MKKLHGFTKKELASVYRQVSLSRKLDSKMLTLLKQGKVFFHIGALGHGIVQVAAALNLKPGEDWAFPYYRDQALCLQLGMTAKEIMLAALAKDADPCSGGRQMPQHYGHKSLRIPSQSSPTGTQFLQATGLGIAIQKDGNSELVYVSAGDGTTSEGDFHEALNWCARESLPVLFHIEDNHYAISVPSSEQTAGSVYAVTGGYENLKRYQVDGTDFFAAYKTFQEATARIRSGEGPCVVISDVIRLYPHSASDDHRKYRTPAELKADQKRDPLVKFKAACIEGEMFTEAEFEAIDEEVFQEVEEAADWAMAQDDPDPKTALEHVYAPEADTPAVIEKPRVSQEPVMMVDAINHALHEEMAKNPKMVIYGEDVAGGKGGVFTVTRGLTDEFSKKRVFNSPLAESSIIGTAIGMALYGYKPVVEIQFGDYIWPAMNQICNELCVLRYRSNGKFSCPVVVRVPVGGYIHGSIYHSQSIDGVFAHFSGVRVVFPSNASDAKALLKTAIRGDDPVLFLEHKGLYRSTASATPEPPEDYCLPFGKANILQKGEDLTIITWGMTTKLSLDAMKTMNLPPHSVELIDLRTLNPLDLETILDSVKKTGKVLVVHEDRLTGGFGGEISALITEHAFEYLDGPVQRIGAANTHIPYSPSLESQVLPQVSQIAEKIGWLLEY